MGWLRRAFFALTFVALGCTNGGGNDGGTDGGADAGGDGGLDAGLCSRGVWTDGSGDGYRAPSASVDGVLGYRSNVSQWALIDYNTALPLPTECIAVTVKDPDGLAVQADLTRSNAVVEVSFLPAKPGVHHVTMVIDGGPSFQNDVAVYREDGPDLTLPYSCSSMAFAGGALGCDGRLLDMDGGLIATVDGRWLSVGNELLAWTDGGLAFASADGGAPLGAPVPAPFPESWSSFGATLAIGTGDGGVVFARDGGSLTAVASLPAGYVDVFSDGTAVSMTVNQFDSPVGLVYSAGADRIVSWVGLNTINGGSMQCFLPDGDGGVAMQQPACDPYFSPRLFHLEANDWRPPRRTLAATEHGVRLPDGGAMFLSDAGQITAEETIVWQASQNQTAIWFR